MAKRKKPEFETLDEMEKRRILETISNHASRSEKTSWNRKKKNMERLISEDLNPLEQQIMELEAIKAPIVDEISMYRKAMVESCVHPFDMLVTKDNHAECKFCMAKLTLRKHD